MDPNCPVCQNSKMQKASHVSSKRRADRYEREPIERFGEITADHAILGSWEQSRNGDQVCLMILDRRSGWMAVYPSQTKDAETVVDSFRNIFAGKTARVKRVYIDGSLGFKKALQILHVPHDVSFLYDPARNGVVENSIRRLKEGARCFLVQSGFSPEWWAEAARCFCNYKKLCRHYLGGNTVFSTPWHRLFRTIYSVCRGNKVSSPRRSSRGVTYVWKQNKAWVVYGHRVGFATAF